MTVVTQDPVVVVETWQQRMWIWTRALERRIWLIMIGGLCGPPRVTPRLRSPVCGFSSLAVPDWQLGSLRSSRTP